MTQRRFNEAEVAAIFERATNAQRADQNELTSSDGLTLSDLHEIGLQVGLAPELITQASATLGQGGATMSRTFMGLPIGVGRTIELGRKISDDEWDRLVVDLRETFDARGVVRGSGSLRQWTNGNLQALLEPTASGHRLRLRTVKGDARSSMIAGIAMLTGAIAVVAASILKGGAGDPGMMSSVSMLAVTGVVMLGAGALRVPAWAKLRRQQMEEIAARLARGTTTEVPRTIA